MSHMLIYMSCNGDHIWILFNNKNVKFVHDHIKNIPAKFAYKRFNGFTEEDKRVAMTLPHLKIKQQKGDKSIWKIRRSSIFLNKMHRDDKNPYDF